MTEIEYATDIDGTKFQLVSRNLDLEKQIWKICLEILAKPKRKFEKKNLLFLFRKERYQLYEYILGRTPLLKDAKFTFQTKIVWTLNGFVEFPKCKNERCGKPLIKKNVFISETMEYPHFCNGICVTSDKDVIEKRRMTNRKHFGTDWPGQAESVKNKSKETCIEHFGVDHYFKSAEFKETVIPEWIEKYGTDNPSKSDTIKEKIRNVFIENYDGLISPNQSPDVQAKRRKHCIEKYGVDNWMKTDEAKRTAKIRKDKEIETKRKKMDHLPLLNQKK